MRCSTFKCNMCAMGVGRYCGHILGVVCLGHHICHSWCAVGAQWVTQGDFCLGRLWTPPHLSSPQGVQELPAPPRMSSHDVRSEPRVDHLPTESQSGHPQNQLGSAARQPCVQETKRSVARAVSPTACHPASPLERPTKSKPARWNARSD